MKLSTVLFFSSITRTSDLLNLCKQNINNFHTLDVWEYHLGVTDRQASGTHKCSNLGCTIEWGVTLSGHKYSLFEQSLMIADTSDNSSLSFSSRVELLERILTPHDSSYVLSCYLTEARGFLFFKEIQTTTAFNKQNFYQKSIDEQLMFYNALYKFLARAKRKGIVFLYFGAEDIFGRGGGDRGVIVFAIHKMADATSKAKGSVARIDEYIVANAQNNLRDWVQLESMDLTLLNISCHWHSLSFLILILKVERTEPYSVAWDLEVFMQKVNFVKGLRDYATIAMFQGLSGMPTLEQINQRITSLYNSSRKKNTYPLT